MPTLKDKYTQEVAPALMQKFGYKSTMEIPRLAKIVVNVGVSEGRENPKVLDNVVGDLGIITGQKAVVCKASSTVCSTSLCPVSATSAASPQTPLTAAATMPWASRSS